jgi:rhodanese-related sulfurtransferase
MTDRLAIALAEFTKHAEKNSNIPVIRTKEILEMMNSYDENHLLLVDVRSPPEIDISTINNAITREELELLPFEDTKDKHIVLFCTIGLRSGNYASELVNRGYSDVRNGEGVVLWSHLSEGEAFFNRKQGAFTMEIHGFGKPWSEMFSPEYTVITFSFAHYLWYGILELFSKWI